MSELKELPAKSLRHLQESLLPDMEAVSKDSSLLMRLIGGILHLPTGGGFMTNFYTTIGNTVYYPTRTWNADWITMFHEACHIRQEQREGKIVHSLLYLFPQVLAVLFLLAIPWIGLWALLGILFLLPIIPAYWRMKKELEAYMFSVALLELRGKGYGESQVDHYVSQFTGPNYLFMWPHGDTVRMHLRLVASSAHAAYALNQVPNGITDGPLWWSAVDFMEKNDLIDHRATLLADALTEEA